MIYGCPDNDCNKFKLLQKWTGMGDIWRMITMKKRFIDVAVWYHQKSRKN